MVAASAVRETVIYQRVETAAKAIGLMVMGALHPKAHYDADDCGTLVLLGTGPAYWPILTAAPEYHDAAPDPVDRFSQRTITALATSLGPDVSVVFPFGGPPYAPFIDWALKSGRAFTSPTGMLVHDTVGMMTSYRGALWFPDEFPFPVPAGVHPCEACAGQPCTTACPVEALGADAPYNVAACHEYLDTGAGGVCMGAGCAARLACPLSDG
ncbi:MAG: ferredoxin, partial [Rhodobacteraceae bacterium]